MGTGPGADRTAASIVAVAAGALLMGSPARALWASDDGPWWSPFAIWVALIGVGIVLATAKRRHGP